MYQTSGMGRTVADFGPRYAEDAGGEAHVDVSTGKGERERELKKKKRKKKNKVESRLRDVVVGKRNTS